MLIPLEELAPDEKIQVLQLLLLFVLVLLQVGVADESVGNAHVVLPHWLAGAVINVQSEELVIFVLVEDELHEGVTGVHFQIKTEALLDEETLEGGGRVPFVEPTQDQRELAFLFGHVLH